MRFIRVLQHHVVDGAANKQRVDAIEDAAVAGNERRAVLHAGAPLQHRLEEIAGDAERHDGDAEQRSAARSGTDGQPPRRRRPPGTTAPKTKPPTAPSMVFFGLMAGASGRRPNARPV